VPTFPVPETPETEKLRLGITLTVPTRPVPETPETGKLELGPISLILETYVTVKIKEGIEGQKAVAASANSTSPVLLTAHINSK
jgi:hypothetical protein